MDVLEDQAPIPAREPETNDFPLGWEMVPGFHAWALLGRGRRCESWLAWSTVHWNGVVLKVPRPGCDDERTYQALAREAEVSTSMVHPQIQRLLAARVEPPLPYLVFEYVEGMTLASGLEENGPLAPGDLIRLGLQIGSVLHYVHSRSWVHLDVKPENVSIRDGRAILMDFDISLPIGEVRSERRPRGTAAYMAPEQIRCEPAARSMDIFGLGATLFEGLTGRPAFEPSGDWPNRVYPQVSAAAPSAASIRSDVPPALDQAIASLLHPDPSLRPSTAIAAMRTLVEALPEGEDGLWPPWTDSLFDSPHELAASASRRPGSSGSPSRETAIARPADPPSQQPMGLSEVL